MVELQDILLKYGEDFKTAHHLSCEQSKAYSAIRKCRTAEMGGHMDVCTSCGYAKPSYNSCRNRNCPKCQSFAKEKWINNQKCDLLNVQYFHVVFCRHTYYTLLMDVFQWEAYFFTILFVAFSLLVFCYIILSRNEVLTSP